MAKKARRGSGAGDDSSDDGDGQHLEKGRGKHTEYNKGGGSAARKVPDLTATPDNGGGGSAQDNAVSPRSSASNRMAEMTGMAPSAEILILQQAREAAKKEAEASGGRRRARAPSRRALEAAGRMTDTGAQWMTQEKKEEMARAAMELREQRKRYRAAGLKVGVVLEEFVVQGKADTEMAAGTAGSRAAGDGGDSGTAGGGSGIDSTPPVVGWRKVSPAELSVPLKQAVVQEKTAPVATEERPQQ